MTTLRRSRMGAAVVVLLVVLPCSITRVAAQACPGDDQVCRVDDDTTIVLETSKFPMLDSWRIFAADTKDLFNPIDVIKLPFGKTKEVGISIANQLAFRVDGFGERQRLLDDVTKLYHNVYEVRVRYLTRGRHRIVYFATTSLCRGIPPCLETNLRPALFAIKGTTGPRLLTWPSIREEDGGEDELTREVHVDSCFGRYGPEDFDLQVRRETEVDPYDDDANSDKTGLEEAHGKLKRADGDFAEQFNIIAERFRNGLNDPDWEGIDSGLRVEVKNVTLPDSIPAAVNDQVPGMTLETDSQILNNKAMSDTASIEVVIDKALQKAISKRGDGEYTLLHFIEPKAHPAPPEAASDVDIVLSATAAISGLIIEEILLGRAFLAGSGPGIPVIKRALTKVFRLLLVCGLFVVDTLPLFLLLLSELDVASYRGFHISGTIGSSIYGSSDECPAGFPLGLGTHVTLISVSDARVALIASILIVILIVRVVMLVRKVVLRKDMFVAAFQNSQALVREAVENSQSRFSERRTGRSKVE